MEAQEFRIGNFTRDKLNKTTYEINVRSLLFITECEEEEKEISIEPIPLTEEWLLKLGFNYQEGKYWIDGLCIHTTDSRFYILQEQGRVFIKYVHQLQNLYFALTGKELTIKS